MINISKSKSARTGVKKKLLILGGFAVALAMYAVWSYVFWSNYESTTTAHAKTVISSVGQVVNTNGDDKIAGLKEIQGATQGAVDKSCSAPIAFGWQEQAVSAVQSKKAKCEESRTRLVAFNDQLSRIISYMQDDAKLAIVIRGAPNDESSQTETRWQLYADGWGSVAQQAVDLKVSTEFMPIKESAISKVQAVKAAWQELLRTKATKDRHKYKEGKEKLLDVYGGLKQVRDVSADHLEVLLQELRQRYEQL